MPKIRIVYSYEIPNGPDDFQHEEMEPQTFATETEAIEYIKMMQEAREKHEAQGQIEIE